MDNFLLLPRALTAFVFDSCFAGAAGALLAMLWLRAEPAAESGGQAARVAGLLWRTLLACAAGMVLATPAAAWLMAATILNTTAPAEVRAQLADVLTGTHAGRVLLLSAAGSVLLLLACAVGTRAVGITRRLRPAVAGPGRRSGVWLGLGVLTLLAAVRSAAGHAAGAGDLSLHEWVQWVHLGSTAVWAGGVMVAGLVALPRLHGEAAMRFARRLSAAATVAVALIALSGIYNAGVGLGVGPGGGTGSGMGSGASGVAGMASSIAAGWKLLGSTQWGLLLAAKSALVALALAMGARNRWALNRESGELGRSRREPGSTLPLSFTVWLRVEAVVMVAILLLSAFLANSPPATGQ